MGTLGMGSEGWGPRAWGPGDGDPGGQVPGDTGLGIVGPGAHRGPLIRGAVPAAWGDRCSGFGNLFTEIAENSAHGSLVAQLPVVGDPGSAGLQLCLAGADAAWFYLDGQTVRLNVCPASTPHLHPPASGCVCPHPPGPLPAPPRPPRPHPWGTPGGSRCPGRGWQRREAPPAPPDARRLQELESPVLMVALTCAEDGFSPVEYRIIVQVLNENDNRPRFLGASVLTHNVSELAAVHSVVFSTQAEDADGDMLMYVLDTASADARYFRIDLPNSGKVVLARALDFETQQQLEVVVHAVRSQ
nr:uncharacterized protein LOC112997041 [Dromaius novaehollandiae]